MKRIALITTLSLGLALGATAPVATAGTTKPNPIKWGSLQPSAYKWVKPNGIRWAQPKGFRWSRVAPASYKIKF